MLDFLIFIDELQHDIHAMCPCEYEKFHYRPLQASKDVSTPMACPGLTVGREGGLYQCLVATAWS